MAEKAMHPLDVKKMYFLGFKEKEDDYEIRDEKTGQVNKGHYHNFLFSLAEPYDTSEKSVIGSIGLECNTYKLKAENVPFIFGERPDTFNPRDYYDWVGQPVVVLYDKKGNIKSLSRDTSAMRTVGIIES